MIVSCSINFRAMAGLILPDTGGLILQSNIPEDKNEIICVLHWEDGQVFYLVWADFGCADTVIAFKARMVIDFNISNKN